MGKVPAILIDGIHDSKPSIDGSHGLICFKRHTPDEEGSDELWISIPLAGLPLTVCSVLNAIPKPEGADGPYAAFGAQTVSTAVGPEGQFVVTFDFGQGAALSVRLDSMQALSIAESVQNHVSPPDFGTPPVHPH